MQRAASMAGRASSWKGSLADLVEATTALWSNGPLQYNAVWGDPADGEAIQAMTEGLLELQSVSPRHNVKYSDFVQCVLAHIENNTFLVAKKLNKRQKKNLAEAEAVKARVVEYHVRREWYKAKGQPLAFSWMKPFPQPPSDCTDDQGRGASADQHTATCSGGGAFPASSGSGALKNMIWPEAWSDDDLSRDDCDGCELAAARPATGIPSPIAVSENDRGSEFDEAPGTVTWRHCWDGEKEDVYRHMYFSDGTKLGDKFELTQALGPALISRG